MTDRTEPGWQSARAEHLRALHHRPSPLVLPNAWDTASAAAVVAAGFDAVATTSGGVAASLGYPDGEQVPVDEMFAVVTRIAAAVDVPVTADLESGYGLGPDELATRLVESGAVGCNLEDTDHRRGGLTDTAAQAERIAAVRAAARRLGVDPVVNARVDVYVRSVGEPDRRVEVTALRADAYRAAGADCVYPILAPLGDLETLRAAHSGPLNAMAVPGGPPLRRLREVGASRISFGSALQRRGLAGLGETLSAIRRDAASW